MVVQSITEEGKVPGTDDADGIGKDGDERESDDPGQNAWHVEKLIGRDIHTGKSVDLFAHFHGTYLCRHRSPYFPSEDKSGKYRRQFHHGRFTDQYAE